ncbi:mitochondrial peripheral inner membrane protein [Lecanora helva]
MADKPAQKSRKISSTSSILEVLSLPQGQNTDNVLEAWQTGIWSVQVMQPELQIARSYTPLPPKEGAEAEQLRLFVRQEPQGEVSSMLHRISRGTLVHLRGPQIEYAVPENVDEVLFLAGGTGIAPALQVAHVLYNHRLSSSSSSDHQPKLRILWANRHREDSHSGLRQESIEPKDDKLPKDSLQSISQSQNPLVDEVDSLKVKHPGKVSVEYFVDDDNSLITESLLRKYLADVVQKSEQIVADRSNGRKLLLISGPEGFIDHYAGPKFIKAGKEVQGPLGGMLEKIKPQGWEIWKL